MLRVLGVASALLALGVACDDTVFQTEVQTYEPTWFGMQVFMLDHCASCHDGSVSDVILPDDVETDLRDEDGVYVVPGDPDGSMLWRVVSGDLEANDPGVMPIGIGPLPAEQIEHVRGWISAGASL